MRPELLKPLRDVISDGHDVRRRAAAAISSIERTGSAAQKQALTDFFSDCASKAGGVVVPILPPTSAVVDNGVAPLILKNDGNSTGKRAAVVVEASAITGIVMPADVAPVLHGSTDHWIKASGGIMITNKATAVVANGVLTAVLAPPTVAGVTHNVALTVPVTGTYVSKITPTVVNGAITGFVLS